jgi:hypothetical protein
MASLSSYSFTVDSVVTFCSEAIFTSSISWSAYTTFPPLFLASSAAISSCLRLPTFAPVLFGANLGPFSSFFSKN